MVKDDDKLRNLGNSILMNKEGGKLVGEMSVDELYLALGGASERVGTSSFAGEDLKSGSDDKAI